MMGNGLFNTYLERIGKRDEKHASTARNKMTADIQYFTAQILTMKEKKQDCNSNNSSATVPRGYSKTTGTGTEEAQISRKCKGKARRKLTEKSSDAKQDTGEPESETESTTRTPTARLRHGMEARKQRPTTGRAKESILKEQCARTAMEEIRDRYTMMLGTVRELRAQLRASTSKTTGKKPNDHRTQKNCEAFTATRLDTQTDRQMGRNGKNKDRRKKSVEASTQPKRATVMEVRQTRRGVITHCDTKGDAEMLNEAIIHQIGEQITSTTVKKGAPQGHDEPGSA
ncbi:hypothetical protein FQA39_LY14615 [Lamprigera yunnana]|nr:hypothetical protein FQA39_LY14615 [Lamprigera yunnana]